MSEPPHNDHRLRVLYRDTDKMGVVYHANYLSYLESGRIEFMRSRGVTYRSLEESGVLIPVLKAECEYLRPAFFDDELRVRSRLVKLTRVVIEFEYEIFRDPEEAPLLRGATRHAFCNPAFKPIRVSHELVATLGN